MSTIDDLWVVGQLFQRGEVDDPSDRERSILLDALLAEDRDEVERLRIAGFPVGLREAALLGDAARVRRLLAAGADPAGPGWTPLHLAAWAGQTSVATVLLAAGVGVDRRSEGETGCTALQLAALRGHQAMVALLLEAGARTGLADAAGWTPLHQAADRGDLASVKHLLNAGAEVNPLCGDTTPLGMAESAGHHAVVALLRQLGGTD